MVEQIAQFGLVLVSLAFLLGFGTFGFISYQERERRAAKISLGLALTGFIVFILAAAFLPGTIQWALLGFLGVGLVGLVVAFLIPIGKVERGDDTPQVRFDERDVMFSRSRLRPGSPNYQAYYSMRPENKDSDDRTRAKPGLYSPESRFANMFLYNAAIASFDLPGALREAVDGPVSEQRYELPPAKMTTYLKSLATYYGALEVGVTELRPYHLYSHIGRGTGTYGEPIPVEHRYALAFTVEMDFQMVGSSPMPPSLMETAKQYVEAARVAVQLASVIRHLGYPARAHIDGNYRVIAPLVARDAGLGEIGRMGILMTPCHGPRVRLGVVTTEVELVPDARGFDPAVIDFCVLCKKCAECCPTKSIPFDDRQEIDGAMRWKIDADTCYLYWNTAGTDCGRCMAVCPYSHPNTFSHNLVRWGISKSGAFRRGALWLDDLFYGKEPPMRKAPEWTRVP